MRPMLGRTSIGRAARLARRGTRVAAGGVLAALSLAYLALAHHVVFGARIGKVVATIDESAGMGVHSGDLIALPLMVLGFGTLVVAGVVAFGGPDRHATPWRAATVSAR